jgi:hypothetical protein
MRDRIGAKADFAEAVKLDPIAQRLIEEQGYSLDGIKASGTP